MHVQRSARHLRRRGNVYAVKIESKIVFRSDASEVKRDLATLRCKLQSQAECFLSERVVPLAFQGAKVALSHLAPHLGFAPPLGAFYDRAELDVEIRAAALRGEPILHSPFWASGPEPMAPIPEATRWDPMPEFDDQPTRW